MIKILPLIEQHDAVGFFFMAKWYSFLSIWNVKNNIADDVVVKYCIYWLIRCTMFFLSTNLSCDDKTNGMHSFCKEMFFASGNVYKINIDIESFNLWRKKKRNKIHTLLFLVSCNIKNSEMITSNQYYIFSSMAEFNTLHFWL